MFIAYASTQFKEQMRFTFEGYKINSQIKASINFGRKLLTF